MRLRLARLVPTRAGEHAVTILLVLYVSGVLAFYYVLKPLKDGLFLAAFPSSDLPYPNFLTALSAGTLATLVFKLGRRVSAVTLITGTNLAIAGTLVLFLRALGSERGYLPYLFYVYVQIVSVLSTAQFWMLAGFVYDSQQAKRLYGLLGAGAIAGAMAGSAVSGLLSRQLRLGTTAKLVICLAIVLGLTLLGRVIWRYRRAGHADEAAGGAEREPLSELLRMVFRSRHLLWMVLLVFTTLVASQLADWQVKDALYERFKTLSRVERKEQITTFLANLYMVTNVGGVVLQLTATNLLIRRFGITAATALLPAALFTSSWGVLLAPGLWTALAADGVDAVFRYSVTRSGMELLYLPVSPASRKRLKLFIDVFIDRLGRFAAALVILAITLGVQASASRLRWTAAVAVALSAAAFGCCLHLRRSYSEAFRQQLSRRELEPDELGRFVTDPASVRLLRDALRGTHDRQRLYALRLSQSVRGADLSPEILPLLEHPSAEVRAEAVRAGQSLPAAHRDRIERLLGDPAAAVRTAVVEYLCGTVSSGAEPPLARLFAHPDPTIRLAAARWLADSPVVEAADVQERIAELLDVEGPRSPEARAVAARLAGRLEPTASIATLRRLLADPDPGVVAATAQAAGAAGHLELLFEIVPLLGDRTRRAAAREALVRYGPRAVGTLSDLVADPGRDPAIRREIPWVLARIATRRSADALTELIGTEDVLLKYRAVKGLNRMHESHPELPVARTDIARHLRGQIRQYYEALLRWQAFQPEIHERRLLVRALKERLDHDLEVIFRLLGLLYPQKDIYFAYTAVRDGRADRRGAAIEFLDTLLDRDFKRLVLPLLEEASADRLAARAMAAFGIQPKSAEDALEVILERSDTWLRACALHEIGERRLRQLRSRLESLAADREPLLRETARWALLRCGGDVGAQGGARAC